MVDSMKMISGTGPSDLSGGSAIGRSARGSSPDVSSDAKKVARDFESFFIFTMLKELEKTTSSTKKGFMEETYMSVVYEKLGEYLAQKGMGLKEAIGRYLERDETKVSARKVDNRPGGESIHRSSLPGTVTVTAGNGNKEEQHED